MAKPGSEAEQVRVETTEEGPVLRVLAVEVPVGRVRKAFERTYKSLGRDAAVRGFRKGKVPRSVLEKLYGASVAEELERALVAESLPDAIELAELSPVSEPDIEAERPTADASFHYTARIEIAPAIELPALSRLPAKRPSVQVEDADVERELEQLRQRRAPLLEEPPEIRVAEGHHVNVDFVGRIDGAEFEGGSGKDVTIEIGSGRMLPGFEEQLVGAAAGEDREVRTTFPDDYNNENLRGKEAVFAVHVASLRRLTLPELDDEFARDLGDFDSIEAVRARIREDLVATAERESQAELRRTLMDSLIERTEFEVPPGMVERQLQRQLASVQQHFEGQVPTEMLRAELSRMREQGRDAAERRVRESLLLAAVARSEQIEASDEEVEARLDELGEAQGMKPAELRKLAEERDWGGAVRAELVDQKALEFLVVEAKVEETTDT